MSFNKIIIVGNLGRDPELKYTPQGQGVCEFSVATSEKRKDNIGEIKEETTWFKVSFWGKLAEVASQYLSKGRQVYIEGRLRTREWTDKEGRTRTSLEISGSELKLLGGRSDHQNNENNDSVSKSSSTSSKSSSTSTKSTSKPSNKPTSNISNTSNNPSDFEDSIDESDIPF